jgi:hypothetical protein
MKLLLAVALALHAFAQAPPAQSTPEPDTALEIHLKALKLIEITGGRARLVTAIPDMIENGKAAMQKQCPNQCCRFAPGACPAMRTIG